MLFPFKLLHFLSQHPSSLKCSPEIVFLPFFLSYDKTGACVTVPAFGCAVMNVCTSFYVPNRLLSMPKWVIWGKMFVLVCLWALGRVSCGRQLLDSWGSLNITPAQLPHNNNPVYFHKFYDQTFLLAKDWRPVQDAQGILGEGPAASEVSGLNRWMNGKGLSSIYF